MGWFWADRSPASRAPVSHQNIDSNAQPPSGCPMHRKTPSSPLAPEPIATVETAESACPYKGLESKPAQSTISKLNPLNLMPSNLSQSRAANQTIDLPTQRELSTIPKGGADGNWEYPSPQQMYNAMIRKGYTDTPQDAVESMVAVHNFLNEGAWAEIVEWERRFGRGLSQGWSECKRGEAGSMTGADLGLDDEQAAQWQPRLLKFMGRPSDMTPKASILQMLGWIAPNTYGGEPPFDRHDWYVHRATPNGSSKEVRYVIDYYSGPSEPSGEPVFYLDVRPAVDTPTAATERLMRWSGDIWWRASGGLAREHGDQQPTTLGSSL